MADAAGGGGGGYHQNSFWDLQMTKKTIFSRVRYLFLFFHPNIKFIYSTWYWPKSVQFGQSAQFSSGLDLYEWGRAGVKIHLCPNLEEGVLKGQKQKIYLFFNQSIKNQKLYNISENKPPKSITRGDMGLPPFLTSKKCCSSTISPPNWARKLKLGMYI